MITLAESLIEKMEANNISSSDVLFAYAVISKCDVAKNISASDIMFSHAFASKHDVVNNISSSDAPPAHTLISKCDAVSEAAAEIKEIIMGKDAGMDKLINGEPYSAQIVKEDFSRFLDQLNFSFAEPDFLERFTSTVWLKNGNWLSSDSASNIYWKLHERPTIPEHCRPYVRVLI